MMRTRTHHWRHVAAAAAVVVAAGSSAAAAQGVPEVTEVAIDLRRQGEPFRGWGTSLSWWAHGVGDWPDETIDRMVHLIVDPRDGLGLNVFRYNIGGGDQPGHAHMRRWGDVPGFKPSADAAYDWDADANQRRLLLKLVAAAEAPVVEAFAVSPPWWMTVSGCSAGAEDAGPNLKPEFEEPFAVYLADVAGSYRDRHGVTFHSVEPLNEPDTRWWKAGGNQEGCHVPREQQAWLIRALRRQLDARGLSDTRVSATDANSIDDALAAITDFDAQTIEALGQVNTHSYHGEAREALRAAGERLGKPLWQSETGPLYVGGTVYEQILKVAERIVLDMNGLRPEAWCLWQVVAPGEWGCLNEDPEPKTFAIGQKFHVLAAFTRHIRPGDRFLEVDSDHVVAAVSETRREMTMVLVNRDKAPRRFRLRLENAEVLPETAEAHCVTETTPLEPVAAVPVAAGVIDTTAPPESVTRLVLRERD